MTCHPCNSSKTICIITLQSLVDVHQKGKDINKTYKFTIPCSGFYRNIVCIVCNARNTVYYCTTIVFLKSLNELVPITTNLDRIYVYMALHR